MYALLEMFCISAFKKMHSLQSVPEQSLYCSETKINNQAVIKKSSNALLF